MIFTKTTIEGVFVIDPELIEDERGFFARSFCVSEFENKGIHSPIVQCNISYNKKKGTLRGMHYQASPFEEGKIVSCTKGAIYDVVLDMRPKSVTYCRWLSTELTDQNFKMIFIPPGCAHGFQTTKDNSIVYYQMTEFFHPECARGVRWNDPAFNIKWPEKNMIISEKDRTYSDYSR